MKIEVTIIVILVLLVCIAVVFVRSLGGDHMGVWHGTHNLDFDKIDSYPRHPSQLYESIGYFSISALIYVVYLQAQRKPLPGRLLGLTLCLGFSMRAFLEFFKENQVPFEHTLMLNMGQLLSLPFIVIGLYLTFGFQRNYLKN